MPSVTCTVKRVVGQPGGPQDFILHSPQGELTVQFPDGGENDISSGDTVVVSIARAGEEAAPVKKSK